MIKAIIFDCYGVLVQQDWLHRKVVNEPLFAWINEHKQKYVFSILSNIERAWLNEHLSVKQRALFTDIVASSETSIAKPDPKVYELAAERLDIEPEECVFVDDVERNVDAAKTVGMHGIHYQTFEQFEQDMAKLVE